MTDKTITAKDARNLAVAYSAFVQSNNMPDSVERDSNLSIYGAMLFEAQKKTGVVLVKNLNKREVNRLHQAWADRKFLEMTGEAA